MNKLKIFLVLHLCILFALSVDAKIYLCASCYWSTECGKIHVSEIPNYNKIVNDNPGILARDRGPFYKFYCSNGRSYLGVLWSYKPCGRTGGLSNIPLKFIYRSSINKLSCSFGS